MTSIPSLVDFPTNDIVIGYVKSGKYGHTFNNQMKDGKAPIFYMGKWKTKFGASQQVDEKTGKPGKPRIELEIGWEKERDELQQKTFEKIMEFKAHAAKIIANTDDKNKLVNDDTNEYYTEEELNKVIVNPLVSKRSKSKKQINKTNGREEMVPYPPKLKLSIQYVSTKNDEGKWVEDPTRVREMYDPQTKKGNRIFRDENGKPMSTLVKDLQKTIPPESELEVWGMFAYTHIGQHSSKGRDGYINIQPVIIKRVSVGSTGIQIPDTIGPFSNDDEGFDESYNDESLPGNDNEETVGGTLSKMILDARAGENKVAEANVPKKEEVATESTNEEDNVTSDDEEDEDDEEDVISNDEEEVEPEPTPAPKKNTQRKKA